MITEKSAQDICYENIIILKYFVFHLIRVSFVYVMCHVCHHLRVSLCHFGYLNDWYFSIYQECFYDGALHCNHILLFFLILAGCVINYPDMTVVENVRIEIVKSS